MATPETNRDAEIQGYSQIGPTEEDDKQETKADPKRFYILFVYSGLCFLQCAVWNTWGSISNSANYAFHWTDDTIFLLSNWGPITYVVSTFFFSWLADVKGLRVSCVLTAALIAGGCGLRCITSSPPAATWLIHAGQILNGFGGPILMGGPPLVSAHWFPVHQRTSATSVMTSFAMFGLAVSFIIAPLIVPDVGNDWRNSSSHNFTVHEVRESIMELMYIEFGISALLLLCTVVYFPNRPKIAPSVTATVARIPFKDATKRLVTSYQFWMLSVPYSLSSGVYGVWQSILDVILKSRGIDQDTAGWVGFWSSIAGCVASLLVGVFADIFAKRLKLMIVIPYIISAAAFLAFTLVYYNNTHMDEAVLYVTIILTSIGIGGSPPLLYELVCENMFPVAEGITNIFMTSLNNLFGMLFLLAPYFTTDNSWMNWTMLASVIVCIPVYVLYPVQYRRFDMDTVNEREQQHGSNGPAHVQNVDGDDGDGGDGDGGGGDGVDDDDAQLLVGRPLGC